MTKSCGTCKKSSSTLIDLKGQKFGSLTVIRQIGRDKFREALWESECSCGELVEMASRRLRTAAYPSCGKEDCPDGLLEKNLFVKAKAEGSLRGAKKRSGYCKTDLVNKRFGNIVVIEVLDERIKGGSWGCVCRCDCGNEFVIGTHWLRHLGMTDCGCLNARNETRFNYLERNLVLGTLLGDGCLAKKDASDLARLSVNHSLKQVEFVHWKYQLLNRFVRTEPKVIPNTEGWGGPQKSFVTICTEEMGEIYRLLYPGGVKTITEEYLLQIEDPIALAVWYMDDGSCSQKKYNCRISTDSFSLRENELLCDWLKSKWGIEDTKPFNYKRKYYNLQINASARDQLFEIIQGHMIPSMKYKMTKRFRNNPEMKELA